MLEGNKYIEIPENISLPGLEPTSTVKEAAEGCDLKNPLTLRMATLYVSKTECDEEFAVLLATKLFEVVFSVADEDDEDEYVDVESCIFNEMGYCLM